MIFLTFFCANILVVRKFVLPLQPISGMNEVKCSYKYAVIAQLVEHNLAKVGVASSSLVHRSKEAKQNSCSAYFL